jgi:uncharacterized membrane protein
MNRWFVLSIVLTVAAFAGSLYAYFGLFDRLPEKVPTHWDIHGLPDKWVPREDTLVNFLLVPGVMAFMLLLTLVLPWLSPKPFEVERSGATYYHLMMLVVALFGWMNFTILLASFGTPVDSIRLMIGGLFLFFALIGNLLGKVQRNFWMGVRTPWTLASETVWIRTHRLTGWLWVPGGIVGAVAVFAGVPLLWAFVWIIVISLVPVVYSLVLYKRLERQGKLPEPSVTQAADLPLPVPPNVSGPSSAHVRE